MSFDVSAAVGEGSCLRFDDCNAQLIATQAFARGADVDGEVGLNQMRKFTDIRRYSSSLDGPTH